MIIILNALLRFLIGSLPILLPIFLGILTYRKHIRQKELKAEIQKFKVAFIQSYIRLRQHQTRYEHSRANNESFDTFENYPGTAALRARTEETLADLQQINP